MEYYDSKKRSLGIRSTDDHSIFIYLTVLHIYREITVLLK